MRTLILCEGKTDAILLSYLLQKESNWVYVKSKKGLWDIEEDDKKDESANWYKRDEDYILICGVGGKDKFKGFFLDKLYEPIIQTQKSHNIDKIIYILDKDKDSFEMLEQKIFDDLQPICTDLLIDNWKENKFLDAFGMEQTVDVLGLVVPNDQEGALENVLLNALSGRAYDKNIVDKSVRFVEEIKQEAKEYIKNSRLELKAKLSVVFAVRSPQKVFSLIDELIKSVNWESYTNIKELFVKVLEL